MIKRTGKPCIKEEMLTEILNDKNFFFFFLLGCEGENLTKTMFRILLDMKRKGNSLKEFYKV